MAGSSPYISFPGNAAEAFDHYLEVFGGALNLWRYGDMPPMEGMGFTPPAEAVAHGELTGGLVTLAGDDSFGDSPEKAADALSSDRYSMLVSPDSVEAARGLIEKLVEAGGSVAMPFDLAPWGDHYGQVNDRFGVRWAFVVAGRPVPEEA